MDDQKRRLKAVAHEHIAHIETALRRWDPIGVLPGPTDDYGPMDEYDTYAPQILSSLSSSCSVEGLPIISRRFGRERWAFRRIGRKTN